MTTGASRWFLRIIEGEDGSWECRRGRTVLDGHADYATALEHIRALASGQAPAIVYAHWLDGRVLQVAEFPLAAE